MHDKLLAIQSELKVPKGQTNTFGGYKYRSCEDIVEAVKPLCEKHEVALTLSDEIVEVASRVYVKATATLTMLNTGREENSPTYSVITPYEVSTTGWAREAETKKGMDEAQITGSASSYARKYALNGLFAIDDTKDPDATNTHGRDIKSKDYPEPPEGGAEVDFEL